MKVYQEGVLPESDIYFHTCSSQAKELFFYLLCTGKYFCNERYFVDRQAYDSYLILYVKKGSGYVQNGNSPLLPLDEGSVAFINCYIPHKYFTKIGWTIYWIHFDGLLAPKYFNLITEKNLILDPQNPHIIERYLQKIFNTFHEHKRVNEAIISKNIIDLLTELILVATDSESLDNPPRMIEEMLTYISENSSQKLSLSELAKQASLSPYYFSRLFKKETGYSPFEYVIQVRIDQAKFLLKTTSMPIKELAFQCGFNSVCSFCTSFKKKTGYTPTEYRIKELPNGKKMPSLM